eukprot:m.173866 g.173866  ORF g.173866 m.173866 type:complete len:61 (-) comp18312_c0_seq1:1105-1287(-)
MPRATHVSQCTLGRPPIRWNKTWLGTPQFYAIGRGFSSILLDDELHEFACVPLYCVTFLR